MKEKKKKFKCQNCGGWMEEEDAHFVGTSRGRPVYICESGGG